MGCWCVFDYQCPLDSYGIELSFSYVNFFLSKIEVYLGMNEGTHIHFLCRWWWSFSSVFSFHLILPFDQNAIIIYLRLESRRRSPFSFVFLHPFWFRKECWSNDTNRLRKNNITAGENQVYRSRFRYQRERERERSIQRTNIRTERDRLLFSVVWVVWVVWVACLLCVLFPPSFTDWRTEGEKIHSWRRSSIASSQLFCRR